MTKATPEPSMYQLLSELLRDGSVTIVTTLDGRAPTEGSPIAAVTTIQLDGDVFTRVREGVSLDAHLARVRRAVTTLGGLDACLQRVVRGIVWTASSAACVPWLPRLLLLGCTEPSRLLAALGNESMPIHVAVGIVVPSTLWWMGPRLPGLLLAALRWWLRRRPGAPLSGRPLPGHAPEG